MQHSGSGTTAQASPRRSGLPPCSAALLTGLLSGSRTAPPPATSLGWFSCRMLTIDLALQCGTGRGSIVDSKHCSRLLIAALARPAMAGRHLQHQCVLSESFTCTWDRFSRRVASNARICAVLHYLAMKPSGCMPGCHFCACTHAMRARPLVQTEMSCTLSRALCSSGYWGPT